MLIRVILLEIYKHNQRASFTMVQSYKQSAQLNLKKALIFAFFVFQIFHTKKTIIRAYIRLNIVDCLSGNNQKNQRGPVTQLKNSQRWKPGRKNKNEKATRTYNPPIKKPQ